MFDLCTYVPVLMCAVSPRASLTGNSLNQTSSRGGTATLECMSLGGPNNTYRWLFEGSNLSGETSTTLTLSNVVVSTGGIYSCVVSNDAGSDSADTFVFVQPYFLSQPNDTLTSVNFSFGLICDAVAFPSPDYLWQRVDGRDIRDGVNANQKYFYISSLEFGDEGEYFCSSTSNGVTVQSHNVLLASMF